MSIEAIVGKAAGDVITIGEDRVGSGVSSAARKMCSVPAVIDFCLLGMHLGVDRYGPHSMESDMFLWDPVNHNPAKKQRVHEIYAPAIAESRYATAALYAMAAPFSVVGFAIYPVEKAIECVLSAAEKISRRYENNKVYRAFSRFFAFDDETDLKPLRMLRGREEKWCAIADMLNIQPESAGSVSSLQNLLNEERLPQVHGGKSI